MSSFDFEEVKQQVSETAEFIAGKTKEYAKIAYDKAKTAGKIAKLSAEISVEKEKIKKAQIELGKKYYNLCKENPAEPLKEDCDTITVSLKMIKEKKAEIQELKKSDSDESENVQDADAEPVDVGEETGEVQEPSDRTEEEQTSDPENRE